MNSAYGCKDLERAGPRRKGSLLPLGGESAVKPVRAIELVKGTGYLYRSPAQASSLATGSSNHFPRR